VIKKYILTEQDKKAWSNFVNKPKDIYNKDDLLHENYINTNKIKKIDLHGFSLNEANQKVKKFIIQSYNKGSRKLVVITGKGLRSKTFNDPFRSKEMSILKNSIPEFIKNDQELIKKISKISKAEIKDGGEGSIYIFLKNNKKLKE
jgi:DNA-nicking Smr family endonuclease